MSQFTLPACSSLSPECPALQCSWDWIPCHFQVSGDSHTRDRSLLTPTLVPNTLWTWLSFICPHVTCHRTCLYLHFSVFPHNLKYHHPLSRVCLCVLIPLPRLRKLASILECSLATTTTKTVHTPAVLMYTFFFLLSHWMTLLWRHLNECILRNLGAKYYVFFVEFISVYVSIYFFFQNEWHCLWGLDFITYFYWCWYCYI